MVGRQHARLARCVVDPHRLMLSDLGSSNGTLLNGKPVGAAVAVESGDIVRLGASGPELEIVIESRGRSQHEG